MFHQILIALFFQIISLKQNESKRFYCDSDDEIKNASKHLKRLIRNDDKIYFVFQNRIIFTKMPKLFKSNINFIDKNDLDAYLFINFNFYEKKNQEIDSPERIPKDNKVLGHSYNLNEKITKEYYVKIIGQDKIVKTEIFDMYYELDFRGDVPAKRSQVFKNSTIPYFDMKLATSYFDLLFLLDNDNDNFGFFTINRFANPSDSSIGNYIELRFTKSILNTLVIEYHCNLTNLKSELFITDYYLSGFREFRSMFFLGLNQTNTKLIIAKFHFLYPTIGDPKNVLIIDHHFTIEYDFDELFSCHTPFNSNDRQIKGIFYDKVFKLFFIFIKRFYLRFDFDLVENGFQFEADVYLKNSKNIEFENDQLYEDFSFENLRSKWVKTCADNVYFIPFYNTTYKFELLTDQNQNLVIKESNLSIKFDFNLCTKQTLVIKGQIFCFTETHYFIDDNEILIQEIFNGSSVPWNEKERLKFIFNYKDNKVVFQTLLNLFVFNYEIFKLQSSNKLNYNGFFSKAKSCLIIPCESPIRPEQTKPTENNQLFFDLIQSYFSEVIVFLVLLLLLIGFVSRLTSKKFKKMYRQEIYLLFKKVTKKMSLILKPKLSERKHSRTKKEEPSKQKETKIKTRKIQSVPPRFVKISKYPKDGLSTFFSLPKNDYVP